MTRLVVALAFRVDPVLWGQEHGCATVAEAEAELRKRIPKALDRIVRENHELVLNAGVVFEGYTL